MAQNISRCTYIDETSGSVPRKQSHAAEAAAKEPRVITSEVAVAVEAEAADATTPWRKHIE